MVQLNLQGIGPQAIFPRSEQQQAAVAVFVLGVSPLQSQFEIPKDLACADISVGFASTDKRQVLRLFPFHQFPGVLQGRLLLAAKKGPFPIGEVFLQQHPFDRRGGRWLGLFSRCVGSRIGFGFRGWSLSRTGLLGNNEDHQQPENRPLQPPAVIHSGAEAREPAGLLGTHNANDVGQEILNASL